MPVMTFSLKGTKELQEDLAGLTARMRGSIMKEAVNEAAQIVLKQMEKDAPKLTGELGMHMETLKAHMYRHQAWAGVGPAKNVYYYLRDGEVALDHWMTQKLTNLSRIAKSWGGKDVKVKDGKTTKIFVRTIAHWIEYGHGKVPPNPFLRRAFDATTDACLDKMEEVVRERVEKSWKDGRVSHSNSR
jgi:hypothetical protein